MTGMLLLLSDIAPSRGTASAEILKRHLDALPEPVVHVGPDHPAMRIPRWQLRALQLLRRVAPRQAALYEQTGQVERQLRALPGRLPEWSRVDLVLTLAHGRLGLHAWRLAARHGLPLVSFFHDWWPEMVRSYAPLPRHGHAAIARLFERLQRRSDTCLCVCEGMAEALVPEARTVVLRPVPDPAVDWSRKRPGGDVLRVLYTGSLWGLYGRRMQALAEALRGVRGIELRIHGDAKYLDPAFVAWAQPAGVLHDFLPYDAYREEISHQADVLLGVMGSGSHDERRMETSFPSKVANYFRTGNAVLLWADPTSSLGRFARAEQYPLRVEEAEAEAVVSRLRALQRAPTGLEAARKASRELGERAFDPASLQTVFEHALNAARQRRGRPGA